MNAHSPTTITTTEELFLSRAARLAVQARNCLFEAQINIDDAGHECHDLNRAYAFTAGLAADLHGRPRPPRPKPVPDHIVKAAVAWRADRDRRARR